MKVEELTVRQLRGGHVESEHPIAAVLCRADGTVERSIGPETVTPWRSGAKAFQLLGSLDALPAETALMVSPEELALGSASHSGECVHTEIVTELLGRFALDETALRCGVHWPSHRPSERALVRAGLEARQVHNNCSGKHAFMAIAARALGFDADYLPSDHPLQRSIRQRVEEHTHNAVRDLVIDGCGAPCFVLSLRGMATAFAKLAEATRDSAGTLGRIGKAMSTYPKLVCGTGRGDLALCEASTLPLIVKIGAEGLLCVAIPSEGAGLVLKVLSGSDDARIPAILAILGKWYPGIVPEGALRGWCEMKNLVGRRTGERAAVFGP